MPFRSNLGPGWGGRMCFFAGVHVSMFEQSGRSPWESGFLFFRTSPPCDTKCLSSTVSYHKATPYSFFAAAFVLKLACLQLQHIFCFLSAPCHPRMPPLCCCALLLRPRWLRASTRSLGCWLKPGEWPIPWGCRIRRGFEHPEPDSSPVLGCTGPACGSDG